MRQNFIAQFVQLLTRGLCNFRSGVIIENWAHSVDQYLQQALQFPVHFINLLSILFRFNNFTGIQNTSGSDGQQAIKVTMTFLGYKFGFGKCFGASSPWRRKWQPTPVSLPGKSHGQRKLVGCSPWGRKESGTTEQLTLTLGASSRSNH